MFAFSTDSTPYERVVRAARPGIIHRKFVRESEVLPGVGFTADLVKYQGGNGTFSAPRHRHDFDQIRFIVSGRADFGHGLLGKAGHVIFFPAGTHYGPEEIEDSEVMLIQWSKSWVWRADSDAAHSEMSKVGEFKDGWYVTRGDDGIERRADARNAVFEFATGKKLVYPTPRYPQPILMMPEGFAWRPHTEGVDVKMLGRFTEDDVYVGNYRWSGTGRLALTPERTQLLWVVAGPVRVGGEEHQARSVIFSDFDESVDVEASEGAEVVVFGLPLPAPAQVDLPTDVEPSAARA
ncbi:hypothetical protein AB0M46_23150 [Dactylosporangium sp. NPDC051485]|uniref:cupin domain-containing protein n=1 Tax=Dactylosporangium sp. NPDC051485 TaxID=3154846 RepID=UPI003431AB3C